MQIIKERIIGMMNEEIVRQLISIAASLKIIRGCFVGILILLVINIFSIKNINYTLKQIRNKILELRNTIIEINKRR